VIYRAGQAFVPAGTSSSAVLFSPGPFPAGTTYSVTLTQTGPGNAVILPMCYRATAQLINGFVIQARDCATGQLSPLTDDTTVNYIAIPVT
jgi:hypothetical protein